MTRPSATSCFAILDWWGVPRIAKPNPSFEARVAVGMLAHNEEDWYDTLKKLAGNLTLRQELGNAE